MNRVVFFFVSGTLGPIITAYLAVSNRQRQYEYQIGFVGKSDGQEPYDLRFLFYDDVGSDFCGADVAFAVGYPQLLIWA